LLVASGAIRKISKKISAVEPSFDNLDPGNLIRKELTFKLRDVVEAKMTKMNIYCGE
jgi:hypothetical protein